MGSRRTRTLLAVSVALAVLTLLVGTRFDPLADLDSGVARWAYSSTFDHTGRTAFWEGVSTYGSPTVMRLAMLVGAAALAVARRWVLALWLVSLTVVEAAVAPAAKLVLGRARPSWADPITTATSTSFPSGHAAASATAAAAVVLLVLSGDRVRPVRLLLSALAVTVAVTVAASRVFLGVHYLTDVVGGALLGVALAVATYALATSWPGAVRRRDPESRTASARAPGSR